jgi:hypothetical protein
VRKTMHPNHKSVGASTILGGEALRSAGYWDGMEAIFLAGEQ